MEEVFQFIALTIISHLLIGCLIVATVGLFLRFLPLNAATRHDIWLGLLAILLFMPLLSAFSAKVVDEPLPAIGTAISSALQATEVSQVSEQINRESVTSMLVGEPVYLNDLSAAALDAFPLFWLGVVFTLLIALGVALKLLLFIRSYRNLRSLFVSSVAVNDDWLSTVERLADRIKQRSCLVVKHSTEVDTPMTSGVLTPWIVLPTALLEAQKSPQSIEQILLHELAHIKRRDPFIASVQALVSIFMFWHPAFHYVNKQIRFERELACDDWVIKYTDRKKKSQIKAYANALVEIAETLQKKVSIDFSVGCVHSSRGLIDRINILLDRNADHSTITKKPSGLLVTFTVLALLIASSPIWPQPPQASASHLASNVLTEPPETIITNRQPDNVITEPEELVQASLENPNQQALKVEQLQSEELQNELLEEESAISSYVAVASVLVEAPLESLSFPADSQHRNSTQELGDKETGKEISKPSSVPLKTDGDDFIVIEDLSRQQLRAEIRKIEQEFYRVFNNNVQEDRLKVHCASRIILGSFIPRRACEPEFVLDARNEDWRNWLNDNDAFRYRSMYQIAPGLRESRTSEFDELAEAMIVEMKENQYFFELYKVIKMLRTRLEELA